MQRPYGPTGRPYGPTGRGDEGAKVRCEGPVRKCESPKVRGDHRTDGPPHWTFAGSHPRPIGPQDLSYLADPKTKPIDRSIGLYDVP